MGLHAAYGWEYEKAVELERKGLLDADDFAAIAERVLSRSTPVAS
jgi:hypothetical protein